MRVHPYLSFNGQCAEAFRFYEGVLGAKVEMMMTYGDSPMATQTPEEGRGKIMHASLSIGDTVLMGSDAPPQFQRPMGGFFVSLNLNDPVAAERIFGALSEGGTTIMGLQQTFWAARFGMVVDRFGTPWMVNCEGGATHPV